MSHVLPRIPSFDALRGLCAFLLLAASVFAHAFGLGLGGSSDTEPAARAGWWYAAPGVETRFELQAGETRMLPLGELVVGAFDSARVLVPGVPADEDRYRLEFELQPEGSAPVHLSASAVVGRAGDANGERLTFDFGAEPVQIGFGRGGVLSVHFRPLDLAGNGRYDLYAEVRLVSPPAELPEPDLVWQLGLGLVLLALVRRLRRRS